MTQRPLLCQPITMETLSLLKPINDTSIIGEEVVLRIGRSGFSLGYVPMGKAEWRSFPPRPCAAPERVCQSPASSLYAAMDDEDGCIGWAAVSEAENGWAEILDLRVDAVHRRCHVASALMEMCEEFVRSRYLRGLRITVTDTNTVACQFLENQGFALQGIDRMAFAYASTEVDKPLARRACALYFYRIPKKG